MRRHECHEVAPVICHKLGLYYSSQWCRLFFHISPSVYSIICPSPFNLHSHSSEYSIICPSPFNLHCHSSVYSIICPSPFNLHSHSSVYSIICPSPFNLHSHSSVYSIICPSPFNLHSHSQLFFTPKCYPAIIFQSGKIILSNMFLSIFFYFVTKRINLQ